MNPPQGDFLSALLLSSEVIGKLLLVAAAGFFVVRRGILHEDGIKGISRLMIDFIVPCSLGVGMLKGFSVDAMTTISPLILLPVLWIAFSSVLAIGYFRLLPSKGNSADNVAVALCAIPNSFYVPLPVVMALVAPADQVMAAMLVGAAVLAINPLQWTLGMWLVMGERSREANWKESMQGMLNGPVIGVVGGAILSQFPAMVAAAKGDATSNMILRMIVGAAQMAGSAMGPLAMLIIGALIGSISLRQQFSIRHLLPILLFRFLLVPGATYLLLSGGYIPGGKLVALVLLVEAASPSAMNLAIAAKRYGGDWETASGLLFYVNLAAVVTLPLWIAVALRLP